MIYTLPTSLEIQGVSYEIRSDFRDVLEVFEALNDVELSDQEKAFAALTIMYPDFEDMPYAHYEDALKCCFWFINGGAEEPKKGRQPKLVDWAQDFKYIVAPINRVIGRETRAEPYMHWWTFLAAYMEIGDCTFAQIVRIRERKSTGKQLDKSDREWYRKNKELVDFPAAYTAREDEILKMWGGK